jgi:hypothetical protein
MWQHWNQSNPGAILTDSNPYNQGTNRQINTYPKDRGYCQWVFPVDISKMLENRWFFIHL